MTRAETAARCDCAFDRFCERGCCRTGRLRARGIAAELWATAGLPRFDQRWRCWLSALRRTG